MRMRMLGCLLVLVVGGCGSKKDEAPAGGGSGGAKPAPSPTPSPTPAPTASAEKVDYKTFDELETNKNNIAGKTALLWLKGWTAYQDGFAAQSCDGGATLYLKYEPKDRDLVRALFAPGACKRVRVVLESFQPHQPAPRYTPATFYGKASAFLEVQPMAAKSPPAGADYGWRVDFDLEGDAAFGKTAQISVAGLAGTGKYVGKEEPMVSGCEPGPEFKIGGIGIRLTAPDSAMLGKIPVFGEKWCRVVTVRLKDLEGSGGGAWYKVWRAELVAVGDALGDVPAASAASPSAPAGIAAAEPAADAPITLSKINAKVGTMFGKCCDVEVSFTLRINTPVAKSTAIKLNAECKVGDETLVDDGMAIIPGIEKLKAGQSKKERAVAFVSELLPGKPTNCTLTLRAGAMFGEDGPVLNTLCLAKGKLTDGPCK